MKERVDITDIHFSINHEELALDYEIINIPHIDLIWIIASDTLDQFYFNKQCPYWINSGKTHDNNIFSNLYGHNFEEFFVNIWKKQICVNCVLKQYNKEDDTHLSSRSSDVGQRFPEDYSTYAITFSTNSISFIFNWFHKFPENIVWSYSDNKQTAKEVFNPPHQHTKLVNHLENFE